MAQAPTHPDIAWFLDECGWTDANIRNATSAFNRWHRWLDARGIDLLAVSGRECRTYVNERVAEVAPSTARVDWRFLRGFYEWAATPGDEGGPQLIDRSPMLGVKAPSVPEGARQRTATAEDYDAIIRACQSTREPYRNRAVVALMFRGGLRVSEVLALNLDEVHLDGRPELSVPHVYVAKPKNGKPRNVPLLPEVVTHLRRYLRHRIGPDTGPVFTGNARTKNAAGRLTYEGVKSVLRRLSATTGIDISAHAFRRGMATDYLSRGGQQVTLQHICGWSDARMVARYAKAGMDEIAGNELLALHAPDEMVTDRRRARAQARRLRHAS